MLDDLVADVRTVLLHLANQLQPERQHHVHVRQIEQVEHALDGVVDDEKIVLQALAQPCQLGTLAAPAMPGEKDLLRPVGIRKLNREVLDGAVRPWDVEVLQLLIRAERLFGIEEIEGLAEVLGFHVQRCHIGGCLPDSKGYGACSRSANDAAYSEFGADASSWCNPYPLVAGLTRRACSPAA